MSNYFSLQDIEIIKELEWQKGFQSGFQCGSTMQYEYDVNVINEQKEQLYSKINELQHSIHMKEKDVNREKLKQYSMEEQAEHYHAMYLHAAKNNDKNFDRYIEEIKKNGILKRRFYNVLGVAFSLGMALLVSAGLFLIFVAPTM